MSIISDANLKTLTDRLACIWDLIKPDAGNLADVASPVAGTAQYAAKAANDLITSIGDYEPIRDMAGSMYDLWRKTNTENLFGASGSTTAMRNALVAINSHCTTLGSTVDSSVNNLSTLLTYRNTTAFTTLLAPTFGDLWYAVMGTRLPAAGLLSPAVHPTWDSNVSANGMGSRAVGGSFNSGTAASYSLYSEVTPLLEITTSFSGGAAAPVISVAGTDHTGSTSTTWDVTLGSNNPTASVSTTLSGSVTAGARQTVTLASATGIVIGSVLTISSGNSDQEVIVVENVSGSDITAVFKKAHSSSSTVTGKTTVALTPSVAGRRLRSVSGITITISSHSAGTVRVVGKQDRVPV